MKSEIRMVTPLVLRVQTPTRLMLPPGVETWGISYAPAVVPPAEGLEGLGDLVVRKQQHSEFTASARALAELFPRLREPFVAQACAVAENASALAADLRTAVDAGDKRDLKLISQITETLSSLSDALSNFASPVPDLPGVIWLQEAQELTFEHTKQAETGVSLSVILFVTQIVRLA